MSVDLDRIQERVGSRASELGGSLSEAVDGVRDRTADRLRADGGSVFRELRHLDGRLDGLEEAVDRRMKARTTALETKLDRAVAASKRTTWPRRLLWVGVGATVGAAAAHLFDPDRGSQRRASLLEQAQAEGRDAADDAAGRLGHAVARLKGAAIEQAKGLLPGGAEADTALLRQRISSEVLGHRADVSAVVVAVLGPGQVSLKGTVPTTQTERALVGEIGALDGVREVVSELVVAGGQPS